MTLTLVFRWKENKCDNSLSPISFEQTLKRSFLCRSIMAETSRLWRRPGNHLRWLLGLSRKP